MLWATCGIPCEHHGKGIGSGVTKGLGKTGLALWHVFAPLVPLVGGVVLVAGALAVAYGLVQLRHLFKSSRV